MRIGMGYDVHRLVDVEDIVSESAEDDVVSMLLVVVVDVGVEGLGKNFQYITFGIRYINIPFNFLGNGLVPDNTGYGSFYHIVSPFFDEFFELARFIFISLYANFFLIMPKNS